VNRSLVAAADPFAHALVAAAVTAPLGRGAMRTGVLAGTLIDIDHIVAARSAWPAAMLSLEHRPRSHALLGAAALGMVATAAGGPVHGWAAFAGLASHLLRDAGDDAAPTPLLWPLRPPRQIGRARAAAGIAALALVSYGLSRRASARDAGTSPPRTA
jgi:membrane-bound metal-dependent hydrolase YbcI (DUF457 family)